MADREQARQDYDDLHDIDPEPPLSRVPKCVAQFVCGHTTELVVCDIVTKCIRPWPCSFHPNSKGEKNEIPTVADGIIQGRRGKVAKKVRSQYEDKGTGLTKSEIREIYE